ncbi:MAG: class I SAM-dependent methyltransferase [Actinomycetota bacterium]
MDGRKAYTPDYYRMYESEVRESANALVPLMLELVRPRSVVDVGCGIGVWLAAFMEHGIGEVLGVDGDWIDRSSLQIPEDAFLAWDLTEPLRLDREFDLVVSLEVAEHLPEDCADTFVDTLTGLGEVVLFSAAIPFQGGRNHLNEQWQDYWVSKFQSKGFAALDCVRPRLWSRQEVAWPYVQNTLVFVTQNTLETHQILREELSRTNPSQYSIVHPRKYLDAIENLKGWITALEQAASCLVEVIPRGETFVMVDDEKLGSVLPDGRQSMRFLEKGGHGSVPSDDAAAIAELARLQSTGAKFLVFGWPSFWWFDYYPGFYRHVKAEFRCVVDSDELKIFALRS